MEKQSSEADTQTDFFLLASRIYKRERLISVLKQRADSLAKEKPPKKEKIKGTSGKEFMILFVGIIMVIVGIIILMLSGPEEIDGTTISIGMPIALVGVLAVYTAFWRTIDRNRVHKQFASQKNEEHKKELKEYRKRMALENRERTNIKREIARINACLDEEKRRIEQLVINKDDSVAIDFDRFSECLSEEEKEFVSSVKWTSSKIRDKIEVYCSKPLEERF